MNSSSPQWPSGHQGCRRMEVGSSIRAVTLILAGAFFGAAISTQIKIHLDAIETRNALHEIGERNNRVLGG